MTGQTLRYKFLNLLDGNLRSSVGDQTWELGRWEEVAGEPALCEYGFHCCEKPYDAFNYVKGNILARVEVDGMVTLGMDKEAWQRMRIVDARHWRKEDSVHLAVFCAELVLHIYEKRYSDDKRPRAAIDAAKAWIGNPSASAAAAAAAYADADAADAASADAASADAAYADAAYAAAAACEETWKKINGWMEERFQQLERYQEEER